MRFQFRDMVPTGDHEMVLRVLESCLQNVSTDIIRKERQITFHGFGPSSQRINPKDTTVMFVEVEDDTTIIDAYVMYQASSLLGDTAQDEIVRQKLEQLLQQMKAKLQVKEPWFAEFAENSAGIDTAIGLHEIERNVVDRDLHISKASLVTAIDESHLEVNFEDPPTRHEGVARSQTKWFTAAIYVVAAFMLMIAGGLLVRLHDRVVPSGTNPVLDLPDVGELHSKLKNDMATGSPTRSDSVAGESPARFDSGAADPVVWLKGWVEAMRSRDAEAQSSFYADPTDRYMGEFHVNKDTILKDKQAAIADRKGLWTIKLEKVMVKQSRGSDATVLLVKHFIDQPNPAEISERFVKSRFALKRMAGTWKITSEQDLP
jgi:hypothetical protein